AENFGFDDEQAGDGGSLDLHGVYSVGIFTDKLHCCKTLLIQRTVFLITLYVYAEKYHFYMILPC
ncbi:MAG: hypothetical protein ABI656_13115, partial [bacterium]